MPSVTFYPQDHGLTGRTVVPGESWANIRTLTGSTVSKSGIIDLTATPNAGGGWDYMSRYALVFQTSSLPDTAVINSVNLAIWLESYSLDQSGGVIVHSGSHGGTVTSADYTTHGGSVSARKTSFNTGTSTSRANNYSLSTGSVSLLGVTGYSLLTYSDSIDSEPSIAVPYGVFRIYSGSYGTVGIRPQLTVSYTVPSQSVSPSAVEATGYVSTPTVVQSEAVSPSSVEATGYVTPPAGLTGFNSESVEATGYISPPSVFLSGVLEVAPSSVEATGYISNVNAFFLPAFNRPYHTVPDRVYAREGSTGFTRMTFTLRQAPDKPIDLTLVQAVTVFMYRDDDDTPVLNGNLCVIEDRVNGIVSFLHTPGALRAGVYNVEFNLELPDLDHERVPSRGFAKLYVRESYA